MTTTETATAFVERRRANDIKDANYDRILELARIGAKIEDGGDDLIKEIAFIFAFDPKVRESSNMERNWAAFSDVAKKFYLNTARAALCALRASP